MTWSPNATPGGRGMPIRTISSCATASACTSMGSNSTPQDDKSSFVLAQEDQPGRVYRRAFIACTIPVSAGMRRLSSLERRRRLLVGERGHAGFEVLGAAGVGDGLCLQLHLRLEA